MARFRTRGFLYWSYWAAGLDLLLSNLQVGLVGVVVRVQLQSLLIVAYCLRVLVKAGESQSTHARAHTHRG